MTPDIVADPDVRFGKPRIDGTRITVMDVVYMRKAGNSIEEVAEEFDITVEEAREALEYYHENTGMCEGG